MGQVSSDAALTKTVLENKIQIQLALRNIESLMQKFQDEEVSASMAIRDASLAVTRDEEEEQDAEDYEFTLQAQRLLAAQDRIKTLQRMHGELKSIESFIDGAIIANDMSKAMKSSSQLAEKLAALAEKNVNIGSQLSGTFERLTAISQSTSRITSDIAPTLSSADIQRVKSVASRVATREAMRSLGLSTTASTNSAQDDDAVRDVLAFVP